MLSFEDSYVGLNKKDPLSEKKDPHKGGLLAGVAAFIHTLGLLPWLSL
jgi:hypothetical protein